MRTFVLTLDSYTYPGQPEGENVSYLHSMQLLVSFKMSLCLLLFMYVLYSICKIAFNTKKRDHLTTSIQVLFGLTLLCKLLLDNTLQFEASLWAVVSSPLKTVSSLTTSSSWSSATSLISALVQLYSFNSSYGKNNYYTNE
jgi:hypothetical protein